MKEVLAEKIQVFDEEKGEMRDKWCHEVFEHKSKFYGFMWFIYIIAIIIFWGLPVLFALLSRNNTVYTFFILSGLFTILCIPLMQSINYDYWYKAIQPQYRTWINHLNDIEQEEKEFFEDWRRTHYLEDLCRRARFDNYAAAELAKYIKERK